MVTVPHRKKGKTSSKQEGRLLLLLMPWLDVQVNCGRHKISLFASLFFLSQKISDSISSFFLLKLGIVSYYMHYPERILFSKHI